MFNVFINNKDPITTIKFWKDKAVMMRIALPDIMVYYPLRAEIEKSKNVTEM